MSRDKRALRQAYDAQRGRCHWCTAKCRPVGSFKGHLGATMPDDVATLDHVYSKLSPLRNIGNNASEVVMACRRCNDFRARAEVAQIPKAEWTRRSNQKSRPA